MRKPLTTRIDTPTAQGVGSWVEFRRPTWGERRKLLVDIQPLEGPGLEEFVFGMLYERLEKWNWKDADGNAMRLPACVDDMMDYTDEEVRALFDIASRAIKGTLRYTEEDEKN